MSAQELADACEEIGYPIPRNVIANMESGRRTALPLVEVMVLAKALHTHPILLVFPIGYVERTPMLPDRDTVRTWDALAWFTGERDIDWPCESDALPLYRAHHTTMESARENTSSAETERYRASHASNPQQRAQAQRAAARAEQMAADDHTYLDRIRSQLRRDSYLLPYLPDELTFSDPHHQANNPDNESDA